MPLATLFGLEWYGPGMLSSIGSVSPTADANLYGTGRMESVDVAVSTSPMAFLVSAWLLESFGIVTPTASAHLIGVGRMEAVGKVNELSQDDVTGAVWQSFVSPGVTYQAAIQSLLMGSSGNPWDTVIESGYTAGEIMQLIAAYTSGKTNIVDLGGGSATVTFRDLGDTKDRIVGDMTGSERTTITLDTDP